MNAFHPWAHRAARSTVLLIGAAFLLSSCAPQAEPFSEERTQIPHELVQPSPVPSVPGTGILSHEYEEREVPPRIEHVASIPQRREKARPAPLSEVREIRHPSVLADAAPSVRELVIPGLEGTEDVYALSPYARLLARPAGPHMIPPPQPEEVSFGSAFSVTSASVEWETIAREAGDIFGLDAALVLAVIRAESAFDHTAQSPAGAQGAMQVMPATQEELGLIDPFDPRANVYAGSQYLMELIRRFQSVELALAAYNAGPANVEKYGGIPPFPETRAFVRRVMAYWRAERSGSDLFN